MKIDLKWNLQLQQKNKVDVIRSAVFTPRKKNISPSVYSTLSDITPDGE